MSNGIIIGIDPGLRGAFVAVRDGKVVHSSVMPLLARQPDAIGMVDILADILALGTVRLAVLEKAQAGAFHKSDTRAQLERALADVRRLHPVGTMSAPQDILCARLEAAIKGNTIGGGRGQSASAAFSYGRGYGMIIGVLSALKLPYRLVSPRTWQKVAHHDMPHKDRKADSIAVSRRTFPDFELRPGRIRKPHDGLADAACMAIYGGTL